MTRRRCETFKDFCPHCFPKLAKGPDCIVSQADFGPWALCLLPLAYLKPGIKENMPAV